MMHRDLNNDFVIYGGGTGLVLVSFGTLVFWFVLVMSLIEMFTKQINFKDIVTFILFFLVCFYFLIYTFKFWKSNFIRVKNERLLISVMDRRDMLKNRRFFPKFNKKTIILSDIEDVSLEKAAKIYLAPALMIKAKECEPYYIDTKPFSKAGFWKLFKEFEKRGVKVQITLGAI